MSENLGAISYTIDADTSPLLGAEKSVDKSVNKIVNDLGRADKATKNLNTTMTKTSKGVKAGMTGMGRGAGMAGIQFQQFIGQVQGGQSVMLALSQQSADLGFVLGAPLLGAIVGISASIAGMLLPNLFSATKGVLSLGDSVTKLTKNFDKLSGSQQAVARSALVEKIKAQKKEAIGLSKEINKIQSELMVAQQQQNGRFFDRIFGSNPEELKTKLVELKASLTNVNLEISETGKQLKEIGTNEAELTKQVATITAGINAQVIALVAGEEAAMRFAIAQQLELKSGEQIPAALDAQITSLFKLKEAQDAVAQSKKDAEQSEREKGKASSFAKSVVKRGLSKDDRLQLDLEQIIRDESLVSIEEFEAAKTSIEAQQAEERKRIRDAEAKSLVNNQQLMTGAVLGFVAASTGALLAGMDEQSGAYKVMFALQKAAAIASTIINAQTASIAALSPITGLGPVAGMPLSNMILGLGYASAGIIAGQAIAGAREHGGPVSASGMYRMGEGNKPEVLQTGQGLFAVPGDNGKVFNQSQLDQIGGGQAVQVSVIVENNMAGQASVSTQTSDDGRIIKLAINEVASQISRNQGQIPRALKQSTNVTMRANR